MKALPVLDPKAAAIDVGSERLHVSIAGEEPKVFGTFTGDLEALRDWFKQEEVRTVAMEATGVYWLYLYEVLEAAALKTVVVNGWPRCMRTDCCAAVLCRQPISASCRITSGCAPTTSSAQPARCRRCNRRSNA